MRIPLMAMALAAALALGCDGVIADPSGTAGGPGAGSGESVSPSDPEFCEKVDPDPGRVTLRRLNRVEYNNTVRDLLGDDSRPADSFPDDDVSGDGFDNNGATLTLGDLHLEKYDGAVREMVGRALADGAMVRARYLDCDPAADEAGCLREFIADFGLRAWRRPVTDAEVERLATVHATAKAEGEDFDGALRLTMRAMLLSPNFIFKVERNTEQPEATPLTDWELASRLSYFLWSSMPDEELFSLAGEGALQDREALAIQVDRMLSDPKADAFYRSFVGQWLNLRGLEYVEPDADRYPEWDEALRAALEQETLEYVRYVVESNAPVDELLTGEWTFVNERLARHYGIEGVSGSEMQRVTTDGATRGGILTQGSLLTVTSHPDVTSPVKRGKWILENILCAPPPDPPDNVDTFIEESDSGETLREKLERHRADPACATCHSVMDPLGFGLENYSPTGAYRTEDHEGYAVDSTGELPDGTTFHGAIELQQTLADDERYAQCVTKKMTAYALGRGVEGADRCFIEEIIAEAERQDLSMREIIVQIVTNEVFTMVGGRLEESE